MSLKRVITLVCLASAAIFGFIFGNEADEISITDLAIFLVALAGILLVQSGILTLVYKICRSLHKDWLSAAAVALVGAFLVTSNAYFTTFINYDAAYRDQFILSIAAGLVFLLIMLIRKWQSVAMFTMVSYFLLSLGLYAYTRITIRTSPDIVESPLAVNSKRNVYLIGNESLHSPKAFRELYGVKDLPHVDYLRSRGFRVLDQAYSADAVTVKNFSRILEFGRTISEAEVWKRVVFNTRNATFSTFSNGGYKVQFIYNATLFGLDNRLVDYAYPQLAFSQCQFLPKRFFYILCWEPVRKRINQYLFGFDGLTPGLVEQRIRVAARSAQPWLTIYHHAYPFHTAPASHSYRDPEAVRSFRASMIEALPRIRFDNFERTIETIVKEDPDAIIVTFGDHGASLTRGADLDVPNGVFSRSEVLEDRFGVLVAVYPRDFCTNRISEGYSTTFLIENVVRCLNDDDAPTAEQIRRNRTFFWNDSQKTLDQYTPVDG